MSYETYRVADLIDEIAMGPFGSNIKVSCFVDSGVPVLNGSNLEGFSLSEKAFRFVTKEKADSLNKANAHRGDIVITHRGTLEDEKGFCAVVTTQDIAKQDYILTPGRYVGIEEQEDDGEPFEEKMGRLTSELSELFTKSHELEAQIKERLGAIGYEL